MSAQAMQALDHANTIRIANAEWKAATRRLKFDEAVQRVCTILDTPAAPYDAMPIEALLLSLPRVGDMKAARIIAKAQIMSGRRRVRDLTARQRLVLCQELGLMGGGC